MFACNVYAAKIAFFSEKDSPYMFFFRQKVRKRLRIILRSAANASDLFLCYGSVTFYGTVLISL